MSLVTDFFRTIILLGAVQGVVSGVLLWAGSRNRLPNRLLAVLLGILSLAAFNLYASYGNWFNSRLLQFISSFIPWVITMPFGPLIYFYIKASLDTNFRIIQRSRIHFVPVIIDLVPVLTAYIFVGGVLMGIIRNQPGPWAVFMDTWNVYADIPRWISLTGYLWWSVRYLVAVKTKAPDVAALPRYRLLQRFTRVFLVFQLIWLVYLIPYVLPRYTDFMLDTFGWYPVYVPLAVMIYWLGIQGFIMTYQETTAVRRAAVNAAPDEAVSQATLVLLNKAMEEDRLYLDAELNLAGLSLHTGLPQKTISAVLNQCLQKNFNEYINSYRVAAFKERILLPEAAAWTIAGVAYDCGFSSLATFQRVFKQMTGLSPSAYRKQAMEAT
ncbi:AraC family transcriptional regulator [Chitinophaga sp. HK235]|uniref:helix-turn-helix domain-containing protein n=1 Tax=Chitinophaga sp. HK235 TaxID=2952571 RepID=UPI001BA8739D|nr:helix-turn-helix domain-containing protein [Chitinophaga sp. HK235]